MKQKIYVIMVLGVLVLMNSTTHAQTNKKINLLQDTMAVNEGTKLELSVEGMSCQAGCANGIDNMLKEQKGIVKSKTTYDNGSSLIWYNKAIISEKEITDLIKDRGFKVEVKKTDQTKKDQ